MDVYIIIPLYNCEAYIEDCINSIIKQIDNKVEIILIDDGSVDNTFEICKSFLSNSNIKYFKNDNHGVSFSRNFGISKSSGKYIMFVDSDDLWDDSTYENIKKSLDLNYDLICFGYSKFFKNKIVDI